MVLCSSNLACRIHGFMSEVVGIEAHHSMLLVSSPPEFILCVLLPRQDVQPDGVHSAMALSWVYDSRSPYGEASVARSVY
ncbi:hypothetical protein AVEN_101262-1 [Araneus ventricosus]|uniref:Uncharacterized protein n=1 Tax=Araneus ventricosus TaxID=182803 RepID=A0A4Y2R1Y8_ARAVE|nr:hypothetical protein AVEN_101262-1 [Araneus ventricosus]